jgi:hypothetical protein
MWRFFRKFKMRHSYEPEILLWVRGKVLSKYFERCFKCEAAANSLRIK